MADAHYSATMTNGQLFDHIRELRDMRLELNVCFLELDHEAPDYSARWDDLEGEHRVLEGDTRAVRAALERRGLIKKEIR
jgi:hypothetical protein